MPACFLNGLCGAAASSTMKMPINDPVLAPFVSVMIKGSDGAFIAQITNLGYLFGQDVTIPVGNAYPAVVKSLQVGTSKGAGAEIEILDQEGGDFKTIFQKLSRTGTATDSLCEVSWGWIATDCDGSSIPASSGGASSPNQQPISGQTAGPLKFLIQNITLDYSFGTVKYTLHCIDTLEKLVDTKVSGVYPGNGKKGYLTEAIQAVCKERGLDVMFIMFTDATTYAPLKFKVTDTGNMDSEKGIQGIWEGKNRSVLDCIFDWVRPHLADQGTNGKGLKVFFEPSIGKNGTLVICPNVYDVCDFNSNQSNFTIASYSVNSGNCSPVISFKPNIAVTATNAYASGGTAGGVSPKVIPSKGPAPCLANSAQSPELYNNFSKLLRVGHNLAITIFRDERLGRMTKALQYAYNSAMMHNLANLPWDSITAELKVQGDPTYSSPLFYIGRFIGLTVINPFAVEGTATSCVWGNSIEPCNEVLSNGSWIIDGVSHDIRDGSYTTTLKIRLATPGYDISIMSPL